MLSAVTGIESPDQATRVRAYRRAMQAAKTAFPPFEALPCANVQPELRAACDKLGKMACSGCKLVSYCSKDCQKEHWKLHKQDCRNPLKNEDWLPSWVREGRVPIFVGDESPKEFLRRRSTGEFDKGLTLWGNVPAMDVINLGANENDATKNCNLNVAFVASGDMRHVVKTINSLPSDYSGNLTVLLNDITVPIACRNLALLSILGTVPDEALAADVALHFCVNDVIAAGKAHGAHPEDIYGCLYFYLTEQLRMFANRIRRFSISFKLHSAEACGLANTIKSGRLTEIGLPPTMQFDRIEVSNILDSQYVGMEAVLVTWGPLLSDNRSATIVGYFLNWHISEKDGRPKTCSEEVIDDCIKRILNRDEKAKKLRARQSWGNPMADMATVLQAQVMGITVQALDAVYDNSKPFSTYLTKEGLSSILKKTKLRLKDNHTVVSRRLRVPLQSPPDALPEFPDDESWYNYTNVTRYTWAEHFVEFSRE
ncbi:hypothetical protein H1R20_g12757, partial [Candolleomyces eurysporus]